MNCSKTSTRQYVRLILIVAATIIFFACECGNPAEEDVQGNVQDGASFDFSTGNVDPAGLAGDFQYLYGGMSGLVAPSGISWWIGAGLAGFHEWKADPSYLPPAQGWTPESQMSGTAGIGVRWAKTAEGRYAMVYSISADVGHFEFYYVYPYGSHTWSDHSAPLATTLTSVIDAGTGGKLVASWQASSSSDAVAYVVIYSTTSNWGGGKELRLNNVLSAELTGLTNGQLYYVWVKACDSEGNRSDLSAPMTATPS